MKGLVNAMELGSSDKMVIIKAGRFKLHGARFGLGFNFFYLIISRLTT